MEGCFNRSIQSMWVGFKGFQGTAMVEGISLNMCRMNRDVKVHLAAISKMYNLRIFKIFVCRNMDENKWYICDCKDKNKFKLYLPQGLDSYLSGKLNYFQWDLYPLKSLPSHVSFDNLVELILRGSRLKKLWNHEVQAHIYQTFLMNLTELHLDWTAIDEVPPSIWHLSSLVRLDLKYCFRLESLSSSICKLISLEYLTLRGCVKLYKFPETLEPMEHLKYIELGHSLIQELPESIENLVSLIRLCIYSCKNIEFLPNSLCNLRKLEYIDIQRCSNLKKLPPLPNASFSLLLVHNERLKSLSELPSLCFCLSAMYCPSLENISNWKAPLLHHLNSNHIGGQTDLHGCENLDQNTRNIVLAGRGIFQILSGLKFGSMWFGYQNSGTSMNIRLPPYWNNDNFFGLAFCVVVYQHKSNADHHVSLQIGCKLNFKTIPDNLLCEHDFLWIFSMRV
ncbi:probable WRKY transcription factor 19 isoform X2 [Ziziphus jujuba]|uniref:Probable WRKY transcription factor 19 isoform X2 n=1 Tax=Ziziphus jujuba TaxID=326968 RepID=A0ABM4ACP5_ZIZJJ|nr:probable WRKY transcription factor 19 isoform X2 [Ziziphus jujuba]